jgi:hypothetical protein
LGWPDQLLLIRTSIIAKGGKMARKEASAERKYLAICWVIISYAIVILGATGLLVVFRASTSLNNWILAYGTITLAFVTVYYAIQSQRLAEQGKKNLDESIKKRNVDFLERKINEFYAPFIEVFNSAWMQLHTRGVELQTLLQLRNEAQQLLWGKGYLISNETYQRIDEWLGTAFTVAANKTQDPSYEDHKKISQALRERINAEWAETENRIREFYGVPFGTGLHLQR